MLPIPFRGRSAFETVPASLVRFHTPNDNLRNSPENAINHPLLYRQGSHCKARKRYTPYQWISSYPELHWVLLITKQPSHYLDLRSKYWVPV